MKTIGIFAGFVVLVLITGCNSQSRSEAERRADAEAIAKAIVEAQTEAAAETARAADEDAARSIAATKLRTANVQIDNLKTAIQMYRVLNDTLPRSLDDLLVGPQPILPEPLVDPWGQPFYYETLGGNDSTEFVVRSAGPDGILRTADDILSAATHPSSGF